MRNRGKPCIRRPVETPETWQRKLAVSYRFLGVAPVHAHLCAHRRKSFLRQLFKGTDYGWDQGVEADARWYDAAKNFDDCLRDPLCDMSLPNSANGSPSDGSCSPTDSGCDDSSNKSKGPAPLAAARMVAHANRRRRYPRRNPLPNPKLAPIERSANNRMLCDCSTHRENYAWLPA